MFISSFVLVLLNFQLDAVEIFTSLHLCFCYHHEHLSIRTYSSWLDVCFAVMKGIVMIWNHLNCGITCVSSIKDDVYSVVRGALRLRSEAKRGTCVRPAAHARHTPRLCLVWSARRARSAFGCAFNMNYVSSPPAPSSSFSRCCCCYCSCCSSSSSSSLSLMVAAAIATLCLMLLLPLLFFFS